MAGLGIVVEAPQVTTGTSKLTVLQIKAPTNQRVKINETSVSFDGTNNAATPILVQVIRQSTAGSGGSSVPPKKLVSSDPETVQTTGLYNISGSTAPTDVDILLSEYVHPQGGYTWHSPTGWQHTVIGGERLGIVITAGASVHCNARMRGEE